jgi:glyoxylase-like metal-dependent hydrolase (beta-lactamase superfamily II)
MLVCLALVPAVRAADAPKPQVRELRLYVFDCGTISPMDPATFNLKPGEIKGSADLVTPCFLVVHPKGTLMWDVGQVPDVHIPDDGTEVVEEGVLRAKRRLGTQLAAVGYHPADITYLAMSHYHGDHTANANMFARSTWIVQQADYDAMFDPNNVGSKYLSEFKDLKNSRHIILKNEDYDVFKDGTVIIKTAPGHTPGHQMLFLKLRHTGPMLLAGDLYHLPEEKTLDRYPTFEFDPALTRVSRKKEQELVRQTGAFEWIQHNPAIYAKAKKAPDFYN